MLPDGTMAGASGSDRNHVWLSPLGSSAGFLSGELPEGTWHIIAGAYHVPAEGVTVEYTLEFTEKKRRLFKGDTHVHTTASDGILTPEEAAGLAKRMGLDYFFSQTTITTHRTKICPTAMTLRFFPAPNGRITRDMPVFSA